MTPLIEKVRNHSVIKKKILHDAAWFELGWIALDDDVEAFQLPFPAIAAVWQNPDNAIICGSFVQRENFIGAGSFSISDEKSGYTKALYIELDGGKPVKFFDHENNPVSEKDESYAGSFSALLYFLKNLEVASQTACIPTPKANSLINKKRIVKGKPPLQFEWKTVLIEPKRAQSVSKGGAHAPPRLHTRRGHYRNYKSGKRVWVRDCMVGDSSRGFVKHDYKVVLHRDHP